MALRLEAWAAWSPGLESEEAWRAWARAPAPLVQEGRPEVAFLPALTRRRCDTLARMLMQVIHEVLPEDPGARAAVPSVFASRYGPFGNMVGLLGRQARDAALSPAAFSHSVNNTQAGIFSIWAGNTEASTCVSARADTFATGFLEAGSLLARERAPRVLLAVGDETVPEPLRALAPGDPGPYALALLLAAPDGAGEGPHAPLALEVGPTGEPTPDPLPDALRFLAWWLSGGPALRLGHGGPTWTFRRAAPQSVARDPGASQKS